MREDRIETLRGVVIVLMVLGHVIGADATQGLRVNRGSWSHYVFHVFEYMRMPLFTVISGYVYAMKPIVSNISYGDFLLRKVQRLVIPFIVASTFFFLVQVSIPGTNSDSQFADIRHLFYCSYGHFWFVQGIFFVFILIAFLEYLDCLNSILSWFFVFILTIVVFALDHFGSPFLSSNRWPFLLLFFLWGLAIKRFDIANKKYFRRVVVVMIIVFITGFSIQQYLFFNNDFSSNTGVFERLIILSVALSSSFLLMNLRFVNNSLMWLGNYSYEIYLYHVFGTAGARFFLHSIGIDNIFLNLLSGLTVGIVLPVLFKNFVKQYELLNRLVFGAKLKKRKPLTVY